MLAQLVFLVWVSQSCSLPATYEGDVNTKVNSKFVDWLPDMYEDACPPCPDTFTSILEQTKDLGSTAWDHIAFAASSVGSSVGGIASDMLKSGVKHTADILVTGHDLVADNLKGAKKLGVEGLAMADKAFTYFTNSLPDIPKFSSFELRSQQSGRERDAKKR